MRRPSPANRPQVYKALLYQTSITYWEMRRPPTNWPQVYRALLHQTSRTYGEIWTYSVQMDPTIKPKCTEPYYTKPVEHCWEMRRPSPANRPQVYKALLYQTSITYWEMKRPPANWPQVYRALLHQTSRTYREIQIYSVQMDPPIEPKCTEPYYTKPVEPVEKWGGPPPLIDPKCTEPYYTKPV